MVMVLRLTALLPNHHALDRTRLFARTGLLLALISVSPQILAGPIDGCGDKSAEAFADRFVDTYKEHLAWDGGDPSAPGPAVRGPAAPLSSPPYPFATWPIGGSETIGYENEYYGALMDTIYCGSDGKAWQDSRVTIYGWIEPGGNISTSGTSYNYKTGTGSNYPAAYLYRSNTIQLDQAAVFLERTPDEIQTDHVDWGFRLTALFGTDYKYTLANGVQPASREYEQHAYLYGADPVMAYAELYIPYLGEGTNIRIGRYISIPDIEAQLAPNNYTYSHSLLYTYDPFTQEGVLATTRLNGNWTVQAGVEVGSDIAFWDTQFTQPSLQTCVMWQSESANDSLYPCLNGLNNQKFGYDNVQHVAITWFHKFDEKWHMGSEAWYMWQLDTPNVNSAQGTAQLEDMFPNLKYNAPYGAQCNSAAVVTCKSAAYAIVNFVEYQIGPRDSITIRNELLNDLQGQRTGFKTLYSEHLIGWSHWFGDTITFRPELRFDHAYAVDAYNNPSGIPGHGSHNQLMLAADLIFHF